MRVADQAQNSPPRSKQESRGPGLLPPLKLWGRVSQLPGVLPSRVRLIPAKSCCLSPGFGKLGLFRFLLLVISVIFFLLLYLLTTFLQLPLLRIKDKAQLHGSLTRGASALLGTGLAPPGAHPEPCLTSFRNRKALTAVNGPQTFSIPTNSVSWEQGGHNSGSSEAWNLVHLDVHVLLHFK